MRSSIELLKAEPQSRLVFASLPEISRHRHTYVEQISTLTFTQSDEHILGEEEKNYKYALGERQKFFWKWSFNITHMFVMITEAITSKRVLLVPLPEPH